jgi:hypothetical protein
VVELGAGLGHLTRALLATGARVVAVERDPDMLRVLQETRDERLTVVAGNAARLDLARVAGARPLTLVGNLPYHLTSSILFEALDQHADLLRCVFTVQKEVAERVAAGEGARSGGILTVLLGVWFDASIVRTVPAAAFHPPPKVDSAGAAARAPGHAARRGDRRGLVPEGGEGGVLPSPQDAAQLAAVDRELGAGTRVRQALTSAGIEPVASSRDARGGRVRPARRGVEAVRPAWLTPPAWTSATSPSRGRSGWGRPAWPGSSPSASGAGSVLEEVEDNPFLARFYQDRSAWAFQTQLFFLLSRWQQQQKLLQTDLFASATVSDYVFAKDRIFATLTLQPAELALYDRVYDALGPRVPQPDLVIFLQCRLEVLLQRIKRRGRDYERHFDADYLEALPGPTTTSSSTTRRRRCW